MVDLSPSLPLNLPVHSKPSYPCQDFLQKLTLSTALKLAIAPN
ncbi:hypothetical protein MYAER_1436 [Microcystis aeruginosa NIES-2549]|uniref:Uncharacterized protein n=1 Tax=Microcystis aeruginosa NIES-2549 TaxID=1641812 RepID=A0A0F6U3A1_MICAE|nr:hypothetical protein MYAER_1436 [Microcystis aeruginosa NIES-2549]AOC52177.1 hypothetical protein amyaer_1446 [Microcystis aeruginosa NIES-2481]